MMLIQIVPRLPPFTDGLGDYAWMLAKELQDHYGIKSHFIVCDPAWIGKDNLEGFSTARLKERSATCLKSNLLISKSSDSVLLHYVGYGYARRGAPLWLINGLENWRMHNSKANVMTMFHEISASGPFWTSSFWLSSLQRRLAARLALFSDTCFTSRQGYAEILRTLSRNKHNSISTLPVFSNIGEPQKIPPSLKDRKRQLVIFGSPSNRARVYKNSLAALEIACRTLAIKKVCDVGMPTDLIVSNINGIPVTQMGQRPAAEISDLLLDSIAGFLDYHTAYLAKSTIFAAYTSHRLIPISASGKSTPEDDLEAGKHYWVANSNVKEFSLISGQEIADKAYVWYQTHKLSEHVNTFAKVIERRL